jgi:hypothetical protein
VENHLRRFGPLLCLEELAAIRDLSREDIACMEAGMRLPERFTMPDDLHGNTLKQLRSEVTATVRRNFIHSSTKQEAASPLGDAFKSSLRIRTSDASRLLAGINLEKDAYEKWWTSYGPDHTGWFIRYRMRKSHTEILAGDYNLITGQGLLLGRGAFSGSGLDVASLMQSRSGPLPHSSMAEAGYFKGVCLDYRKNAIRLTTAVSRTFPDGRISFSPDSSERYFSLDFSGYHRTLNPTTTSEQVSAFMASVSASVSGKASKIGLTACHFRNELASPPSEEPYRMFRPVMKENTFLSFDYRLRTALGMLFSEAAVDRRYAACISVGWLFHPDRNISAGIVARKRDRSFESPFSDSRGFVKGPGEAGMTAVINFRINDRTVFQLLHNRFTTSWIAYGSSSPVRGISNTARLIHTKGKSTETILQARYSVVTEDVAEEDILPSTMEKKKLDLRYQLTHRPAFGWQVRWRADMRFFGANRLGAPSLLLFEEVRLPLIRSCVTLVERIGIFRTDGYEGTIYSQESMPVYSFGSAIVYGTGWRGYLMAHISLSRKVDGWIRAGLTRVYDRSITDALAGQERNSTSEFMLQLRWKLE